MILHRHTVYVSGEYGNEIIGLCSRLPRDVGTAALSIAECKLVTLSLGQQKLKHVPSCIHMLSK